MLNQNQFVFSGKYRLVRHLVFWTVHIVIFSFLFKIKGESVASLLLVSTVWVPAIILYSYPIAYWLVPQFLLKEKYAQFTGLLIAWAIGGYFLNYLFRIAIIYPISDFLHFKIGNKNPWAAGSYLTMNVMAGITGMIVLFKHWINKQMELLIAEKEKTKAELQLLKAQVHPHFLFNTLNNIYSFSLENSPKTPALILKLSSLLSYVLYDCSADEVLLSKEIDIMLNYIDLEKERYGNRLELSVNIEGDIEGKLIAPLLLLPFLENAFKHGTSEQLEKPWLSFDLSVRQEILQCKIVNSKIDHHSAADGGIGISNARKRADFHYADHHEIKIFDEGDMFIVSLMLYLKPSKSLAV